MSGYRWIVESFDVKKGVWIEESKRRDGDSLNGTPHKTVAEREAQWLRDQGIEARVIDLEEQSPAGPDRD
jgi:hypothetical protein